MRRLGTRLVACAAAILFSALVLAAPASAALINWTSTIDGAQANAGAGTGALGTGVASGTLDDATNLFSWNISWSGLTGPVTVAHFHGPALPIQNAGVQVNFGSISGLSSPSIGSTNISGAQAADLLADLWYINIHTAVNPGGEIRGQVLVPEPSAGLLALLGLGALLAVGRRRS